MNIAICIKQVPDSVDIKWTENNTIQRDGLESVINPFDLYAIESALRLKRQNKNLVLTTLTMGPLQAEDVIRKSIALGVDKGFVVTDKKFAGADTLATARTLATAISKKIDNAKLVICGQCAVDGDTAQTPPSIAQKLNYSQITYVKEIVLLAEDYIVVKRQVEDGTEIVKAKLPCVISMLRCDFELSRPLINGFKLAQSAEIPYYSSADLGVNIEEVGIKGSPTYVSKTFRPNVRQSCEKFKPDTTKQAVDLILENINDGK